MTQIWREYKKPKDRTSDQKDDLKAKLVLAFLWEKAKSLISRLTADELDDYERIGDLILSEIKLTVWKCEARFDNAIKRTDETQAYVYFAALLRNTARFYLRSRGLSTYDSIVAIIVRMLCWKSADKQQQGTSNKGKSYSFNVSRY